MIHCWIQQNVLLSFSLFFTKLLAAVKENLQTYCTAKCLDHDILTTVRTELELELMADVTGQQGILTHPSHLIPPLVFPGVHVDLIFTVPFN
jgi:hypothetical protein